MPHYVDGFVLAVPRAQLEAYRQMAEDAGRVWMDYGALEYRECVADDVSPGKLTSFPQAVQLRDDEVVVFSWILYESRDQRDTINAKAMEDPRIKRMDSQSMPFDASRMFWGGFSTIVKL